MIVLGIESSCDETAASIVKNGQILSNSVYSQEIHKLYGGVVPEVASREHEYRIVPVVKKAISEANITISDIEGIAVTYGPGLMGALLVGLNFTKGLSIALSIPYIGVNHLEGHLFASMIDNLGIKFPFLNLLVSGGHTQLWIINNYGDYKLLGTTVDDAAGEAFDKGARMLGLNYPGGPEIQKTAIGGNPNKYNFPRPFIKKSKFNYSFSGLKTALLYTLKKMTNDEIKEDIADLSASYQEAIVDTLIQKIQLAVNETGIKTISISGGVAANQRFRDKLSIIFENECNIFFPPFEYCTDNGAMIALTGYKFLSNGVKSLNSLKPIPNLSLV
jgi:N6-L-threonylcarbamoyladenine synthase